MSEAEYIAELKACWPQGAAASRAVLSLACSAVQEHPGSARLWFMRGQLIWMSPGDYFFSKLDALTSFAKAVELDPSLGEAYREFGRQHKGLQSDPKSAIEHYNRACGQRGKLFD